MKIEGKKILLSKEQLSVYFLIKHCCPGILLDAKNHKAYNEVRFYVRVAFINSYEYGQP